MAKKKSKRDYDEDDDLDDVDSPPQPKSDAYTGLVVITTVCLIAAAVLFYLDGDKFSTAKAGSPTIAPNALVATKN